MIGVNSSTTVDLHRSMRGFDYGGVSSDTAGKLRKQAERIRARITRHTRDAIETGRDLIAVKDHLDHGQFTAWVEVELGIPARTAQAYMQAARFADDEAKTATVALLPPKTLHRLAAKSTPAAIKVDVLRRIEAGEVVPDKEVANRIAAARSEQQRAAKEAATKARRSKSHSKRAREQHEAYQREEERRRQLELTQAAAVLAVLVRKLDAEDLQLLRDNWWGDLHHLLAEHLGGGQ
jgi:Protein of unknown function (DUF3102)